MRDNRRLLRKGTLMTEKRTVQVSVQEAEAAAAATEAEERKFYGMRNDYMFHVVMQNATNVLKHLLAVLLDLELEEIKEVRVLNPLTYGQKINAKKCVLDVRILLNNEKSIDLELQIYRQESWQDRSLLYWCRTYDTLHGGEDYGKLKPACHIGILDFTLFEDKPEFFSEYRILNVINRNRYSNKFCILVLDLSRMDLAKDSEKEQELLKWARIFKADSLERLEELSKGDEVFNEMCTTVRKLNEDEFIREECEDRAIYEWTMREQREGGIRVGRKEGIEEGRRLERENTERERLRAEAAEKAANAKDAEIAQLKAELQVLKAAN